MSVLAKGLANTDGRQYEVSWAGNSVGWTKDVDPSGLKPRKVEQRIGELNDILVNTHWRGGVDGTIKMTIHEVVVERLRQLMPWAGATGSIPISPLAEEFDEYSHADELRLHPRGAADATNDIVLLKAFPMISLPKSAGNAMREVPAEFSIYPDHTALEDADSPTNPYGYVGEPPA